MATMFTHARKKAQSEAAGPATGSGLASVPGLEPRLLWFPGLSRTRARAGEAGLEL